MNARPKRIMLDVRLLSRGGTSGIPEYTRNLVGNILAAGSTNDYVLLYTGLKKQPIPKSWTNLPQCSVLDITVSNKLLDLSSRLFNSPKFDKKIKPDLVFSPHFNILPIDKTPHVITFHDLSFLHHPYFFSYKQKFWHWLQNYKHQAQRARRIIAVSEFTKNDIVTLLGVPGEKISVVYSGINKMFRPSLKEDLKQFRALGKINFPFLLYLGTLEPRKNVEAVIRAFTIIKERPSLKDLRLIIAGKPGWLYGHILKSARKSPCSDHIIFRKVADDDRALLYSAAELFLFPSFFEGFGFPPLEAQACGTPVVVSDRASLPEVMDKSALYVNPWSVTDLAEQIIYLLTNPKKQEELVGRGFKNIERFTWSKTARETLKILEDV